MAAITNIDGVLKSILFAALDDYLNGRVSAEYAKTVARLAVESARTIKTERKLENTK